MPVVLVRHALAQPRSKWDGEDARRPLTPRGERQADGLARELKGVGGDTLIASPTTRCKATLRPLARDRHLEIKSSRALEEGHGDAALDLVLDLVGDAILCTHGDVVEDVLRGLRHLGWPVPERPHKAKGSVWLLSRERCDYLRPLA